jgi:uncharacterized protein (TIGR00266 family)
LRYEIFGGDFPAVKIFLNAGEGIYTQSGGMTWMSSDIDMATNMKGGLLESLGRKMSGESLFVATYTARAPQQFITVAAPQPGGVVAWDVAKGGLICQKNAFMCAERGVRVTPVIPRGLKGLLFGGEGFLLQELSGTGMVFLGIDGCVEEMPLTAGEQIIVQTGNVAAYEPSVRYSAQMVKGFFNVLFGGEGLFLTTLTGPGRVYLQTMTIQAFAAQLIPYLPKLDRDFRPN